MFPIFTLGLSTPNAVHADEKAPAEAEIPAEAPALDPLHDDIRTIWHDAWPGGDA